MLKLHALNDFLFSLLSSMICFRRSNYPFLNYRNNIATFLQLSCNFLFFLLLFLHTFLSSGMITEILCYYMCCYDNLKIRYENVKKKLQFFGKKKKKYLRFFLRCSSTTPKNF